MKRLARDVREAWEVPRDLVLGRYPEFVTGGPLPRGQVPVFAFHGVEPESFGAKLRYLSDNGYVTLSADEYFLVLMGARPAPDRAVVLSFDDGRGSLWSVGLPLMRRYGFKGIVFLVPGRTRSRPGPPAPTLDDAPRGGSAPAEALARDADGDPFLSWEEVEAMARSGLFDFESHTLLHSRVHTGPHLAGFVTPASRGGYAVMDVPLVREGEGDRLAPDLPLGTPLLRSSPRTSEALRFFEDASLRDACVARVADEGEGFFLRRDWQATLRGALRGRSIQGRLETPEERAAAIRRELADAKRAIEEHTGRAVRHLCYPWHVSGPTARRLALETGYRTAFCGKVPGVPITPPGGDPQAIARVGEDYVELLPGRGRSDLMTILRRKLTRRFGAGSPRDRQ